MLKNCATIFSLLFLILFTRNTFAQESNLGEARDEAVTTTEKVNLPYQTVYFEDVDILYDNGPLVTLPGGGCSGGDASILDGTLNHTLYGWNVNQAAGAGAFYYMADDFTSGAAWNIDSIKFFAYQTGAATSTLTGVYVQIWNGAPNAGGSVVWGNTTTNVMQRTGLTNIYRALDTAPTNCDRRVQEIVAAIGTNLPPGTYWVQWGITGLAASGPWQPPVTITGQAVTGDALQLTGTGWTPALNNLSPNGAPFIVYGTSGPPIGPGPATDPNPADGATGVTATGLNLSWTNPAGATTNEVLFGDSPGSLASIHSGSLVSTVAAPSSLAYNTTYYWRVNETDGSGTTTGPLWSFTTEQNPLLADLFFDDFESGMGNWTVTNNGGSCDWLIFLPPYPNTYTLPATSGGGVLSADSDECGNGTTINSTATVTNPINAAGVSGLMLTFDNDFRILDAQDESYVEVSTDGGTNWTIVWSVIGVDRRNSFEEVDLSSYDGMSFMLRFRSVQPGWDWWWTVDNVRVQGVIPVELTSFTASVISGHVNLNWQTASETNNYGFEVERKAAGQDFTKVAFVAGYGTTTEAKNYSYLDNTVSTGSFTYRLKQVDFDGTFEYSNEVEVDLAPSTYVLAQNYPNPFNPTTRIDFSLASDSKVTLKIFDVLGQEVRTLINGNLAAQSHSIEFDATSLNSGIYFYTIEAKGVDGTNFTSTKKMILTK